MKVLYIGNYFDGTGWGNAAANNILAMHKAGIDVVPRRITYSTPSAINEEIQSLEKKSSKNCDVCIQHCLPQDYVCDSSMKCIGIFHSENYSFSHSLWQMYINTMNEAWVCSNFRKISAARSGVKIPVNVFRASIDFDLLDKVESNPTVRIKEIKDSYNFCFFGEFNSRKNLSALITAFHLEFDPYENVNLFFKISGGDQDTALERLYGLNDQICGSLKLRNTKKIRGLSGYLNYQDYLSLMSQCHCMVVSSHGEDPCIPMIEAQGLGLEVLCTKNAGMDEYCNPSSLVESRIVPCVTQEDSLPELYSGKDCWSEIDIYDLRMKMRKAYERSYQDGETRGSRKTSIKNEIRQICTHEKAGQGFKKLLCQSENI
jgi:glycosyltransferase involved in cell wall biosynthesis